MKRTIVFLTAFVSLTATPALAVSHCAPYGNQNESAVFRLCPDGTALEKRYLYFGTWSDWSRLHPNIIPPCTWHREKSLWACPSGVTVPCSKDRCG